MREREGSVLTGAFLRLWVGTTASGLATWALPFVLGIAVVEGALSATGLGLALAARTLGFLVVLPAAGVVADRRSPRGVVTWSGVLAGAACVVVAVGLDAGPDAGPAVTAAGAFLAGAGQGACRPAFQALVPAVVSEDRRQAANAAVSVAVRVSVLVGPALAALGAAAMGVAPMLLVLAGLWLLASLVPPHPDRVVPVGPPSGHGLGRDFLEGVAEARRHPWFLAGLGALTTVIMTGYSVTAVVLPLVSRETDGSATLLASAVTAYTVGALAGGLLVARWRPRSAGWVALAGLGLYALSPLSLLVPSQPVVVLAAYAVAGVGIELFNVPWFTAIQREVPADRLSRVSSLDFLVSYGLAPVGLALIVPLVDAYGATAVLVGCSVACVLGPAVAATVPSSRGFSTRR
ncbi:MFS transporter [Nocardioides alkalitolerans]|uniref:MFS transporter n=1 Tax=Nocardioides alkalitolerans TaxID=281714 RepID=UPI0003FB8879|nr:MFS transporter [Nocardioides alkalitolerans]